MRAYDLTITNEDGSVFAQYGSHVNGALDPGALQLEFDVNVAELATPIGAMDVKLWGVSLTTIGQASDFNGKFLRLAAGMKQGLPLANPDQYNEVLFGRIQNAFGNWIDIAQWVEFIVLPGSATINQNDSAGLNIVFSVKAGQPFGPAIQQALKTALPNSPTPKVSVSSDLILPTDEDHVSGSLFEFAKYLKQRTKAIKGGTYSGVDLSWSGNTLSASDNVTGTPKNTNIAFNDLIGQPTWIGPGQVQVTTALRGDIGWGELVTLPNTPVTTAPSNPLTQLNKSVFQGQFQVSGIRHLGNYRQPSALAWVTVFNLVPYGGSAAGG